MQSSSSSALGGFIILVMFLCGIALYVFYCYCLKRIVEKCGEEPGAIIWVPIVQFLPLFRVAKLNPWLILLMLVPVANLVVTVLMWLGVLKVLGGTRSWSSSPSSSDSSTSRTSPCLR